MLYYVFLFSKRNIWSKNKSKNRLYLKIWYKILFSYRIHTFPVIIVNAVLVINEYNTENELTKHTNSAFLKKIQKFLIHNLCILF